MIRYENDCVDCGFPCQSTCKYKEVPHYYCDHCGDEDDLFYYDDEQLCIVCIKYRLEKVE